MDINNLKLDDLYIIEEKPLKVKLGKKYLLIKPLSLRQADKFEMMLADLLIKWNNYLENISILDYGDLHNIPKLEAFSFSWKRKLKKDKRFLNDIIDLICKPYKFPVKYFKKYATYETVTQCFLATQLINYDAVKKNIQFLIIRASIVQQSPASLSSLLKNLDGQKNMSLTPRY